MNNGVLGGLGVVAVVGALSQGYLSQLKAHIQNAVQGPPAGAVVSQTTASGGVITNNPTQSIQQQEIAPGAPRPQVADPGRPVAL